MFDRAVVVCDSRKLRPLEDLQVARESGGGEAVEVEAATEQGVDTIGIFSYLPSSPSPAPRLPSLLSRPPRRNRAHARGANGGARAEPAQTLPRSDPLDTKSFPRRSASSLGIRGGCLSWCPRVGNVTSANETQGRQADGRDTVGGDQSTNHPPALPRHLPSISPSPPRLTRRRVACDSGVVEQGTRRSNQGRHQGRRRRLSRSSNQ